MTTLTVDTRGPGFYEITEQVSACVTRDTGVLTVFVRHTSCSLLIQENADPSVRADLDAFFRRLIPPADTPAQSWITHRSEGPDDMPAHLKAAVLPVSLSIPIRAGRLGLGTWQGVYLFEHRDAPHRRQVLLAQTG
ncbi:MAG: secondary thiamine-phosphate synthase enzyme YjbQ [Pseudomonadota bacterium]